MRATHPTEDVNSKLEISFTSIAEEVIKLEARAIMNMSAKIDDNFVETIKLINKTQGRLIVTGVGKSGLIGRKMVATFASTGTPSFFLHPTEAFHGDLGMVTSEDLVLAISYSGETSEVLQLIPYLTQNNIAIIAISGNPISTLVKNSKYHLNVHVDEEACPLDLAPTSSTTATLVMGDALAIALMRSKNFKPEDFAQFHPGGSLGKKLLTKVSDVMYKENLPILYEEANMTDIIGAITKGKLGLVVIKKNKNIVGIITDGDLRRIMKKKMHSSFDLLAKDFMTTSPIQISPNMKIGEVEQIMINNKITSILISENNSLIGVADIYNVS